MKLLDKMLNNVGNRHMRPWYIWASMEKDENNIETGRIQVDITLYNGVPVWEKGGVWKYETLMFNVHEDAKREVKNLVKKYEGEDYLLIDFANCLPDAEEQEDIANRKAEPQKGCWFV